MSDPPRPTPSRQLRLTLAYDGAQYSGWQVQAGKRTLQGALEDAIRKVCGTSVRVTASGRTDAGVHALAQVAAFAVPPHVELDCATWRAALNANLPLDMHVSEVAEATPDFHPIRDATGKRYRYWIDDGPQRDLFLRHYSWRLRQSLDVAAMRTAARCLVGRHDFKSFEAAGAPRASTVRTVRELTIQRPSNEPQRIGIEIEANGFLYNMVRNIVGSLVEIGRGKRSPEWLTAVRDALDRTRAGPTAPPHALFLVRVSYPPQTTAAPDAAFDLPTPHLRRLEDVETRASDSTRRE